MIKLAFKPKQIAKSLISVLPKRAQDVVKKRFGLEDDERKTLESIGQIYGITRERVRQIENFTLNAIKRSSAYKGALPALAELKEHLDKYGTVAHEKHFLGHLAKESDLQNHIYFFLVLGDDFKRAKENDEFHHRWTLDEKFSQKVEEALNSLYAGLTSEDVLSESEIVARLKECFKKVTRQEAEEEVVKRWLALSRLISKNPIGDWGVVDSPNIRIRGMRDLAYLVLKRHGSPLHFSEVAKRIEETFERKAHVATCHNELIKDERFVLVGRGLYALSVWGYASGTVKDIIANLLQREGALSKDQIVNKVLKERYVKENTIGVNLQNSKFFKKDSKGQYSLI